MKFLRATLWSLLFLGFLSAVGNGVLAEPVSFHLEVFGVSDYVQVSELKVELQNQAGEKVAVVPELISRDKVGFLFADSAGELTEEKLKNVLQTAKLGTKRLVLIQGDGETLSARLQ